MGEQAKWDWGDAETGAGTVAAGTREGKAGDVGGSNNSDRAVCQRDVLSTAIANNAVTRGRGGCGEGAGETRNWGGYGSGTGVDEAGAGDKTDNKSWCPPQDRRERGDTMESGGEGVDKESVIPGGR